MRTVTMPYDEYEEMVNKIYTVESLRSRLRAVEKSFFIRMDYIHAELEIKTNDDLNIALLEKVKIDELKIKCLKQDLKRQIEELDLLKNRSFFDRLFSR